jgi:hypothetical protein
LRIFSLQDGRIHDANADDIKLGSIKLAIGATLSVIYAPDKPAGGRAVMSWGWGKDSADLACNWLADRVWPPSQNPAIAVFKLGHSG